MPFVPNTFSDYAVEVDIRRIEDNRKRAEEALIDAITEYDEIDYEQLDDEAVQEGRW